MGSRIIRFSSIDLNTWLASFAYSAARGWPIGLCVWFCLRSFLCVVFILRIWKWMRIRLWNGLVRLWKPAHNASHLQLKFKLTARYERGGRQPTICRVPFSRCTNAQYARIENGPTFLSILTGLGGQRTHTHTQTGSNPFVCIFLCPSPCLCVCGEGRNLCFGVRCVVHTHNGHHSFPTR